MTNIYINIKSCEYFSKLTIVPHTKDDMQIFIDAHSTHEFFSRDKIAKVFDNYEQTALQLDAIFIFCRTIPHYTEVIREMMVCFMQETSDIFINASDELVNICQKTDFFANLSDFLLEKIDCDYNNVEPITCNNIFAEALSLTIFNMPLLTKNCILEYLSNNKIILFKYGLGIHKKLKSLLDEFIPIGNTILDLCSKTDISADEIEILKKFIAEHLFLVPNLNTDKTIVNYYETISYLLDSTTFQPTFQQSYGYNSMYNPETIKKNINEKLKSIGYEIVVPNNLSWMHTLLECFVEHEFAEHTKEIATRIANALITNRNTPRYINKYDTVTLQDYFTMICIANEISTSYDSFIISFLENKTTYDFPAEILMRILSRVYDVDITFYTNNLVPVAIYNAINYNAKLVTIYQYSMDYFFNVVPIGSNFVPIAEPLAEFIDQNKMDQFKNEITCQINPTSQSINNTKDIVDV